MSNQKPSGSKQPQKKEHIDESADDHQENTNESNGRRESTRFRNFAKNIIFGENESAENNSSLIGSVLETGDKAKSEMVRMFGREVRNYLNALEIGKDIHNLLTNYSLEVNASFHLKPLSEKLREREAKSKNKSKGEDAEE